MTYLASNMSSLPPGATSASPSVMLLFSGEADSMLFNSLSLLLMASSLGTLLYTM